MPVLCDSSRHSSGGGEEEEEDRKIKVKTRKKNPRTRQLTWTTRKKSALTIGLQLLRQGPLLQLQVLLAVQHQGDVLLGEHRGGQRGGHAYDDEMTEDEEVVIPSERGASENFKEVKVLQQRKQLTAED